MFQINLPSYLKVLGRKVRIVFDGLTSDSIGHYNYAETKIAIREEFKDQELHDCTILHEIIHATLDRIGTQLDTQLEEVLAESLATVISENFRLEPRYLGLTDIPDVPEDA